MKERINKVELLLESWRENSKNVQTSSPNDSRGPRPNAWVQTHPNQTQQNDPEYANRKNALPSDSRDDR